MPCASTGIAATLLFDGTTAHQRFIIPRNVKDDTQIRLLTLGQAEILMAGDIVILDEVTALHSNVFDYIDRMLRHVEQNAALKALPFAGKVVQIKTLWVYRFFRLWLLEETGSKQLLLSQQRTFEFMTKTTCTTLNSMLQSKTINILAASMSSSLKQHV